MMPFIFSISSNKVITIEKMKTENDVKITVEFIDADPFIDARPFYNYICQGKGKYKAVDFIEYDIWGNSRLIISIVDIVTPVHVIGFPIDDTDVKHSGKVEFIGHYSWYVKDHLFRRNEK